MATKRNVTPSTGRKAPSVPVQPKRVPVAGSASRPYQRSATAIRQDEDRIVSRGNATVRRRRSGETDLQPVPNPPAVPPRRRTRPARRIGSQGIAGFGKPRTEA